jgi:hypothetical protein
MAVGDPPVKPAQRSGGPVKSPTSSSPKTHKLDKSYLGYRDRVGAPLLRC